MIKEDWIELEKRLSYPFGNAKILADGFTVSLQVHQHKMRLVIVPYVNGFIKSAWISTKSEECIRFFRPLKVSLYKPSEIKRLTAGFGKKSVLKHFPGLHEKGTYYTHEWNSFPTLKRHLIANNKSIQLLRDPVLDALNAKAADLGLLL